MGPFESPLHSMWVQFCGAVRLAHAVTRVHHPTVDHRSTAQHVEWSHSGRGHHKGGVGLLVATSDFSTFGCVLWSVAPGHGGRIHEHLAYPLGSSLGTLALPLTGAWGWGQGAGYPTTHESKGSPRRADHFEGCITDGNPFQILSVRAALSPDFKPLLFLRLAGTQACSTNPPPSPDLCAPPPPQV